MDAPLPKLRAIDVFPVELDGRQLVCLRDPLQLASDALIVAAPAVLVLALLDGTHTVVDVQDAWVQRFGTILPAADVRELIAMLDRHHYLESPAFAERAAAVEDAFRAASVRAPAHAGTSYPDDRDELTRHLHAFFNGVPPPPPAPKLRGIVAPHIDLRVGGTAYGHAYAQLANGVAAERFVILGTSHYGGRSVCIATRKDYATPIGTVTTDRAFLDRLAARVSGDVYADEMLHRVEHAVEFQVLMLQHVLGARRPFTVVPLLVGSFAEMIVRGQHPARDPVVADTLAALRATIAEDPLPTVVIAGVDFAHVGAKFGDVDGLTPELLATTETKDRRLIAALEAGDPERFFAEAAADGDRTRICGLAPLYAFLTLMDGAIGRLLHYDRSRDDATRSSVTYASLAFS